MSSQQDHQFQLEQRLDEAQALLIALNSEQNIRELPASQMMSALAGIEHLVDDARAAFDGMLDGRKHGEGLE